MTVHFDVEAATLRMDRAAFDSLVAWAGGGHADNAHLADLRAAGAIRNGRPHPALMSGLGAVSDPRCRLGLWLHEGHRPRKSGEGWITADAATILLDLPDRYCELVAVHPTFLPVAVANLVALGPRPRLPGDTPVTLPAAVLDDLLEGGSAGRGSAAGWLAAAVGVDDAGWIHTLATGASRTWGARVQWAGGTRTLRVLDTAVGVWRMESTGDPANRPGDGALSTVLYPTSPTLVWRLLTGLLPPDVALDRDHATRAGVGPVPVGAPPGPRAG